MSEDCRDQNVSNNLIKLIAVLIGVCVLQGSYKIATDRQSEQYEEVEHLHDEIHDLKRKLRSMRKNSEVDDAAEER